jgi:hypothetical protein
MRASMRPKVRVVLPLVQVLVAIALITSYALRRPDRELNSLFRAPDWLLCSSLNAPATLARGCLIRITNGWSWGPPRISFAFWTTLYVMLVWLLWYLVSIEIGGKGQSILTPKTRMRRMADLFLIVVGAAVALGGLTIRRESGFAAPYSTLEAVPYFIWGVVISVFYGHDLWVSVGGVQSGRAARDHS